MKKTFKIAKVGKDGFSLYLYEELKLLSKAQCQTVVEWVYEQVKDCSPDKHGNDWARVVANSRWWLKENKKRAFPFRIATFFIITRGFWALNNSKIDNIYQWAEAESYISNLAKLEKLHKV